MLYGNQSFNVQRQASEQFCSLRMQARRGKLWSALSGRRRCLLSLQEVQKHLQIQARSHAGLQLVPIAQIGGSESRCTDFDADFRPLQEHTQERWVRVAIARSQDVALPAVELVQVNGIYFVRDGHHRISVAKMLGQQEIEAVVTVWRGVALPASAGEEASPQPQPGVTPAGKPTGHLWPNLGRLFARFSMKLQARHTADASAAALQGSQV
jgi:hypothetical protein